MEHSFNVDIAVKCGVHAAIILNNLAYWIAKNVANRKHFYDGRFWTYNSKRAMAELFPYLTERQVKYALEKLKEEGLIIVSNHNKAKFDQTLWYALTDKAIEEYFPMCRTNMDAPLDKIVQSTSDKIVQPIPNNKPNNKQHIYVTPTSREKVTKKFVPPTLEEIQEYVKSRNSTVDAQYFYDYFTVSNWVDGQGKQVKNWKQKLITWEKHNSNYQQPTKLVSQPKSLDMSEYTGDFEPDDFEDILGG